ncbi:MAG: AAA family ATPase [Lentisphaeria bacterium]|nr:AAA family ATPase [Lentisphaeria bacterium]
MNNTIIDMHNCITADELEKIVRHQLKLIFDKPEMAESLPPLMIWGAPGLGKSTIIRTVAEDMGIGFIDVRLAQREPVDIRGLPVPDETSVRWLVSADWPRDPESKGLILFDELTAADRSLQVAAYEFILDRRLGNLYEVPKGWYICAAGNRVEDSAVAMTMSSALANRFCHVELTEDAELWVPWGLHHNIHPAILGFIRFRPSYLFHQDNENLERGWPTPRSWERVSTMLHTFDKEEERLLDKIIYGLVGNQAGVEFCAFRKVAEEFDNVYELMTDPKKKITIPEKADRKYAFCSAVIYHLWRGKTQEEEQALLSGFYRIATKLTSDFATMMMLDAMQGNQKEVSSTFADKLFYHPDYAKWADLHGKAMRARLNRKAILK